MEKEFDKQYVDLAGASRLLSDEEIDQVMKGVNEYIGFSKEKGNRIISSLKNRLTDMKDIGRGVKRLRFLCICVSV